MESRYGCSGRMTDQSKSVTVCVLFFFFTPQIVTRFLCWRGPATPPWTVWSTTAFPACRTAGSTSHLGTPSPLCITWWNTTQVCVLQKHWTQPLAFLKHFWNKHIKKWNSINCNHRGLLAGSADGLCCRLTGPCFIRGLDEGRQTRLVPTARRRPTINWKDISRCGRFCWLQSATFSL